jgi:hypothetical protein
LAVHESFDGTLWLCCRKAKGGQMTISPPAKVKNPESQGAGVLASNMDKLDLSINIHWVNDDFFKFLEKMKNLAVNSKSLQPISLSPLIGNEKWKGMIRPHGSSGYAWLLDGQEFVFKIGNWLEPQQRPSVFVEIHSEALWRLGPDKAIERVLNVLKGQGRGCLIESIKPSRVDLCVDTLMDEADWDMDLIRYRVTRAAYCAPHFHNNKMTGISIGKGKISARLYDKPLEIKQQSKKFWMYDVWGIESVPKDKKIIRTEFQLRREAITSLGIDDVWDLLKTQANLWGHCTQNWLKFRDRPGKHHNQRKTFGWWVEIQNGYHGVHQPIPLIRFKAMNGKAEQLCTQAMGFVSSFEAVNAETYTPHTEYRPNIHSSFDVLLNHADAMGKGGLHFAETVNDKRVKHKRSAEKALSIHERREFLGFPCNIKLENGQIGQNTNKE